LVTVTAHVPGAFEETSPSFRPQLRLCPVARAYLREPVPEPPLVVKVIGVLTIPVDGLAFEIVRVACEAAAKVKVALTVATL
jgi:hypothetical protein